MDLWHHSAAFSHSAICAYAWQIRNSHQLRKGSRGLRRSAFSTSGIAFFASPIKMRADPRSAYAAAKFLSLLIATSNSERASLDCFFPYASTSALMKWAHALFGSLDRALLRSASARGKSTVILPPLNEKALSASPHARPSCA